MEDQNTKLRRLLSADKWTGEERQWLQQYLRITDSKDFTELMLQRFNEKLRQFENDDDDETGMLINIHKRMRVRTKGAKVVNLRLSSIAAASVIGLVMIGSLYWLKNNSNKRATIAIVKNEKNNPNKEIAPGTNKAILTLADGSTISLDDALNGNLAQQGNTKIIKFNGKLAYHPSESLANKTVFNKIATPRGGQYQVTLPDGSEVWLNASSSIRFPTTFTGSQRVIELTGEAYFEVAKNAVMPFIVKMPQANVEVLGTHFNIMSYNEESVLKTTLLEGSVKFITGNSSNLLKPGQQSQLAAGGKVKIESGIDVDEVIAWKNGIFHFEHSDIGAVMRQLSRWYDVEVDYSNTPVNELFHADISRKNSLSKVLKALELTGKVHFQLEGKKIIVRP